MASNTTPAQPSATPAAPVRVQSVNKVAAQALKDFSFLSTMGTEMVDLYVGASKTHFRVHKKIICQKIPYFEKMFMGGFSEAAKGEARFPDDNPGDFDKLLNWVYHGFLQPLSYMQTPDADGKILTPISPITAYILADKLCLPDLCDEVMDIIFDYDEANSSLAGLQTIQNCYEMTIAGSNLRKFASHTFFFILMECVGVNPTAPGSTQLSGEVLGSNVDLAKDIVKLMRENRSNSNKVLRPNEFPRCYFHCHGSDEQCYSTKSKRLRREA